MKGHAMKWLTILVIVIAVAASVIAGLLYAAGRTDDDASPLRGVQQEFEHANLTRFAAFFQKQHSTSIAHNLTLRNLDTV
jgi:membrane protein DedA with SNARE-associated domain